MSELLLRVARFPDELNPVPVYSGDPPAPIRCAWLVVTHVPEGPPATPETFLLYFLGQEGEIHECLQYETLEIAIDQAHAVAGLPRSAWIACDAAAPFPSGDRADVDALAALVAG